MIKIKFIVTTLLFSVGLFFSGCGATHSKVTKGEEFPKMYIEKPRSILVLPPMNESTDAEAKEYYMTTIEEPLGAAGYYVFPIEMVSDIMKQEGAFDTELLYKMPPSKLYEYFGADTVLYTRIKKWDVAYAVIASTLSVSVEAEIISTKTSEKIWGYTGTVWVDLSGGGGDGTLLGLLVKAVSTAINTALADYVTYAKIANDQYIYTLPFGPYHEKHLKDQEVALIDQTPKKKSK